MTNYSLRSAASKQSGFIEISLISALVVFVSITILLVKYSSEAATQTLAEKAAENYKAVVAASMSWYQDKGSFPASTANLVPNYMSTVAQTTPWGGLITISSTSSTLTVQTGTGGQPNAAQLAGIMAGIIPLASQSGSDRTIITATYGKPGTEPALESLVRRDGSRTLTAEWDVGGQGISNVRDMTLSGINNRTLMSGLTWSNVQQNIQPVSLVNCPPGKSRKITVMPLSYNKNGFPFNRMGAVEGLWDGSVAYVRIWETDQAGNQSWFIPGPQFAYVRVDQQCNK
jgi:hypothetical protein